VPVRIDLGTRDTLTPVTGGDDARRAEWIPAETYAWLCDALTETYGGAVFAAHVAMLRDFLAA
jgi:ADP-ribose pyrophosphatase